MTRHAKVALSGVAIALITALIGACSGGPGDSEFVAACLKEGGNAASNMLDTELGVTRDSYCKCAAEQAGSSLSADARRAMILDMEGKKGEASAISSKMSESEQTAFMQGAIDIFQRCAMAQ